MTKLAIIPCTVLLETLFFRKQFRSVLVISVLFIEKFSWLLLIFCMPYAFIIYVATVSFSIDLFKLFMWLHLSAVLVILQSKYPAFT